MKHYTLFKHKANKILEVSDDLLVETKLCYTSIFFNFKQKIIIWS